MKLVYGKIVFGDIKWFNSRSAQTCTIHISAKLWQRKSQQWLFV